MPSTIQSISAGRVRSVLLTQTGDVLACGAIKTSYPSLPPEILADLCRNDATEVGHNRFAQPLLRPIATGVALRSLSDAPLHTLGVAREGAVLSCQPLTGKDAPRPAAVAGLPADAREVFAAEAQSHVLCASGEVWSWGLRPFASPTLGATVAAPQRQTGLPPVAAMATGLGHVLALTRDGQVWTWGSNSAGQLGLGDLQPRLQPQCVALGAGIVAVGAGDTHSMAIDARGRLWAWGANNKGQLGPRRDGRDAQPYEARPMRVALGARIAQVDGGMYYTVARTSDGEVYSWGWNDMGQLGRDESPGALPARIAQLRNVRQLSAGQGHVLARSDNAVLAWGDNRSAACGLASNQAIVATPNRLWSLEEALA